MEVITRLNLIDPNQSIIDYIMDEKTKDMLIRDGILALISLILAITMFYIAKFIFVEIQFTILGGAFMAFSGMVVGGWIYHLFYQRQQTKQE